MLPSSIQFNKSLNESVNQWNHQQSTQHSFKDNKATNKDYSNNKSNIPSTHRLAVQLKPIHKSNIFMNRTTDEAKEEVE